METNRLEAFSDGVIAVIITVLVLEMKVPHGPDLQALAPVLPVFLSYVLSFVYLGIYWNNHHHMLHVTERVGGGILWANLHLLFWLSLVPFVTGWMGENHFATVPTALYGFVLLMAAVAYTMERLRDAAGNFYVNDKPTGAVVGQQPFGGGRASGTNDKAGSAQNLMRWTSTRAIKETLVPPTDYRYPHMG